MALVRGYAMARHRLALDFFIISLFFKLHVSHVVFIYIHNLSFLSRAARHDACTQCV